MSAHSYHLEQQVVWTIHPNAMVNNRMEHKWHYPRNKMTNKPNIVSFTPVGKSSRRESTFGNLSMWRFRAFSLLPCVFPNIFFFRLSLMWVATCLYTPQVKIWAIVVDHWTPNELCFNLTSCYSSIFGLLTTARGGWVSAFSGGKKIVLFVQLSFFLSRECECFFFLTVHKCDVSH